MPAGSPPARELIGWCRVLFVAHQLSQEQQSLAAVPRQLDVPSWRNLNYLLRRYLGTGAQQLRRPSAFDEALAAFHGRFDDGTTDRWANNARATTLAR